MKKVKRIIALVIAAIMIVSLFASCKTDKITISIAASSDTMKKGDDGITIVALASNGGPITLSVDKNDVVEIVNNVLKVKDSATITSDVEVTLTATLNEDPTINATKKFTVKADVEKVRVVLDASSEQIGVKGQVLFSAVATDNSAVRIRATGDNANLVKIENRVLTVVGEITMDTAITVVAELVDDPSIFATKVITIKGPQAGAWIKINPTKYTITMANDGFAILHVTSYNNGEYTISISGDKDDNVRYNDGNKRLFVIRDVAENKEITVTATLTDDPTVKHSVTITVAPAPVVPTITISTANNKDMVSKDADLALTVKVSTDEAYDLTVSQNSLVEIVGSAGSEKLTVVGDNTFDTNVTVTATLRSDPTIKTTKTILVKAPRVPGSVQGKKTVITDQMFAQMANPSITISGTMTDVFENFNAGTTTYNNYDIMVKMVEGKWYGAWRAITEGNNIVNEDTYVMSSETATISGVTGHIKTRVYIDMNNQVAQKNIVDFRSVPVLWEDQYLWNHFGEDDVNNYIYREEESPDEYDVYEFNVDKSDAVLWYLTYLSYAYTPLLEETLDKLYLKVVNDGDESRIVGMIAYTSFIYEGASSEADGATSLSYSKIELNFTDIGTTTIPDLTAYSAPTHGDALQSAINNMQNATNYTFTAIDKTTYAPSVDEGDYTIESVSGGDYAQTMSTSKNYSSSVSPLGNGDVGLQGFITSDAILLKSTFKYSAAMDDNVFRIENYGYYQKNTNYYDYFEYDSAVKGFVGKQQSLGSISDKLPKWNFSANVFEYIGVGGNGTTPTYKFRLRDAAITRDVAMAVSMHSYSHDGDSAATRRMEIEVATDGSRVVSVMYPYSINDTYMGYITTTYSNLGTTSIAEGEFEDYSPRVLSPNWVDYQLRYYHADHITQNPYDEGTGETILKIMFGDKWSQFPKMTVFTDAFGDNVNGPFFDWDEIENPNGGKPTYKDYFSLTADTDDYDENMTISYETYKRIIDKLTEGLKKNGFTVSFETEKQDPADRTDRYISYINEELGCQIVVENNHTKNFWIDVGYLGDWSFN